MNTKKLKQLIYKTIRCYYSIFYPKKILLGKNTRIRKIRINGNGGMIQVGENTYLNNCSFYCEGDGNMIIIGDNVKLNDVSFVLRYGSKNKIILGNKVTIGGNCFIEASENTTIEIGEDCMLSHNIQIISTDHHPIYNYNQKRINKAKDIIIGNHVWIGLNSIILKGSSVPSHSVIASNTVFTASSKGMKNSIFAGNPARVCKSEIQVSQVNINQNL